jgi:hypothetical protein
MVQVQRQLPFTNLCYLVVLDMSRASCVVNINLIEGGAGGASTESHAGTVRIARDIDAHTVYTQPCKRKTVITSRTQSWRQSQFM